MTAPVTPRLAPAHEIRSALKFFQVMAMIVGVGLLVLVVEMAIKYGMGRPDSENPLSWWPQPHGFLFMVYAAAAFLLSLKARWGIGKLVGVLLAGCVPFLSFVVERKVTRETQALLAGQPDAPAAR